MNDKIIERIRALLALGASGNQNEAENAMRLASRLMMKHEISEAELRASGGGAPEEPPHADHDPLYTAGRKIEWKSRLGSVVARAYNCRIVNWTAWADNGRGKALSLRIFGRRSDVDTVRYLFTWLVAQAERLAAKEKLVSTKKWRSDWLYGFANGINEQLAESKKVVRSEASSTALVLVDSRAKLAEVAYEAFSKDAGLKNGPRRHVPLTSAYEGGKAAGKRTHLGHNLSGETPRMLASVGGK